MEKASSSEKQQKLADETPFHLPYSLSLHSVGGGVGDRIKLFMEKVLLSMQKFAWEEY